jgi:hypothetical protein
MQAQPPARNAERLLRVEGFLFTLCICLVALVLLISVGGEGIVAAPVTLSLLYWRARRHSSRAARVGIGVIAGLTGAEFVWGIVYKAAGDAEPKPWIWLLPLVGGCALIYAFAVIRPRFEA